MVAIGNRNLGGPLRLGDLRVLIQLAFYPTCVFI